MATAEIHIACDKVSRLVAGYATNYEFDDGEAFHHSPTELETMLIADAIAGLLADDEFVEAFVDWQLLVRAFREAVK